MITKPKQKSKFRDASGRLLTRALFVDATNHSDLVGNALYSTDHTGAENGITDLHRAYMEMEDLTEYEFALKYFESWEHWVTISKQVFLAPIVASWRSELELKIRARALRQIKETAEAEGRNSWEANKFLVQGSWLSASEKKVNKRGRPSRAAISEQAVKEFLDSEKKVSVDYNLLLEEAGRLKRN